MDGQNTLKVKLRYRAKYAQHHCQSSHNQNDIVSVAYIAHENQGENTQHRIHANFSQHAAKHSRNRRRRFHVGARQPEIQRENRAFQAKHHEENHRADGNQALILHGGNFGRQIRHVQGAHHTIKQRQGDYKHGGGKHIHNQIFERLPKLPVGATQNAKHVASHQHNFKHNVQVENIAGDERAVHAHHNTEPNRIKIVLLTGAVQRNKTEVQASGRNQGNSRHHNC